MLQLNYFNLNNILVGNSRSFIQDNMAQLAFMEIFPKFQRQGYGSKLLSETENTLRRQYDTYKLSLLAWQPYSSNEVVDFYKKNGYLISNYQTDSVYDDTVKMWDLIQMHKNLKPIA